MKMTVTMALIGGMGVAAVMYFVKHPEKFKVMKEAEVDAVNKMNQMINE